jgi:hypothetical protein
MGAAVRFAMPTAFLLIVGERIVPGLAALDREGRQDVTRVMAGAAAARPARMRRQLAVFLRVLRWLPVVRYGRPFDRLDPGRQDAVLHWFQDAPVAPLRHGFWGVKTLVYMGYYGRPQVAATIGYRPSLTGNDFLHAR